MALVSLRRPYQIFSDPLPPPPPLQLHAALPLNQTCNLFMPSWTKAQFGFETRCLSISAALDALGRALRLCYRRKLLWPVEETISLQSCPRDYLDAVLRPIVNIFNQLHAPGRNLLITPMEIIPLNIDKSLCAFTFQAEEFADLETNPPIVLFVPVGLFTPNGTVTLGIQDALSKVLKHTPKVSSIVATNLTEIAVFTPPREEPQVLEYIFERLETTQFTLALRAISTALLFRFMPHPEFIQHPYIDVPGDIRRGPPQNSDQPLLSDQEVFESCRRLADFDLVTLPHYPARAYQFFRWCKYVKQNKAPIIQSGDVLNAETNNAGTFFPENAYPVFPFDLSELPMDTSAHLKAIQRESPLATADIGRRLGESRKFTIKILETISENSACGMSSVYLCKITSIDGQSISSPTLCLKLFDDRFQELDMPDDDDPDYLEYFIHLDDAPSLALNEAQIYDKLRPVQGSIIPWFYGVHQFTLPDGLILPGLIMEYISGSRLDSDYVTTVSIERQIQMIRSCRHACRVLDAADVSQHDQHSGQILIHTNEKTKFDHAVFIDFAFAVQTWRLEHMYIVKNYFDLFYVLKESGGVDGKLVDEHFGAPDDYDFSEVINSEYVEIKAKDMFPYISFCEDFSSRRYYSYSS